MNGLGGGGGHHHHRRGGFFPYPYPIQYTDPWYSERIYLVEPDPGKDPCPPHYVLSKATKKCVKVAKKGMSGLGGGLGDFSLFGSGSLLILAGFAAGWFLARRR
jgi:hypothetical protein